MSTAAFGTHSMWNAFQIGEAASLGVGFSMVFAEALSNDGKLSDRGAPYLRGLVGGLMTVASVIKLTLPYLIANFVTATALALPLVTLRLLAIAFFH